ncbi:MAG: tRNA (N(6)-L-threonylcarbamoyladenosine(37)-C(2))-methylthiotransferase MtaB [Chloroflexi bacterium]|nr:tRNA (N(6)-L-threonylcarbamoyladenosine(37)-C(2))-methylthiotransferase MtaB [Chloroflexota bacterium]
MRIALDTIGCKLNQAETEELARQLAEAGHRLVSPANDADVYILNTCSVTLAADSDSRQRLRLAHHRNPNARLIVTGCYAQIKPAELAQIEGVSLVVSNGDKPRLLEMLRESGCFAGPPTACDYPPGESAHADMRTRAFVKVQEGCSHYCSYCIVPLARGVERSQPAGQTIAGIRRRTEEGYQEVVLTGTEIGAYRDNGAGLQELLQRILAETPVMRLRLSSLQPQEISSGLLRLWQDSRLCPHFHLSLQSGSDTVLERMKRGYSTADYQRTLSMIRGLVPDAAITTDVIVGFPGETKGEFAESYDFCMDQGFARIHVFPFSPRPGTHASRMPLQPSPQEKRHRSRKMLGLARNSAENFRRQFLGRTMPVLWETKSDGVWTGLTGNYIRVFAKSDRDMANRVLTARLVELTRDGVRAELMTKC